MRKIILSPWVFFLLWEKPLYDCGNKQRPPKWEQAKAVYSELSLAREPATFTCIWQRLKGRQKNLEGRGGAGEEGVGNFRYVQKAGNLEAGYLEAGPPMWLVRGGYLALSDYTGSGDRGKLAAIKSWPFLDWLL